MFSPLKHKTLIVIRKSFNNSGTFVDAINTAL